MQPRFVQIKTELLQQIEQGLMQAGDKVPSENQLAQQFSVSRMTARRAITELVDEGVLIRSQGLGSFVADQRPMSSMLAIRSIQEEIQERGHRYNNQVLQLTTVKASAEQSQWLGVRETSEIFHSQVVHMENQVPIQFEERWVNPQWAPDYGKQDLQQLTAHQYLNQVAPLTEADHIVEAIVPPANVAQALAIELTQPCLKVSRRTYSSKGIVSYAQLFHPGHRYRLGGHLDF